MKRLLAEKKAVPYESQEEMIVRKDGTEAYTRSVLVPLLDGEGNVTGCVKVFVDMLAHAGHYAKLAEEARTDRLTGLLNRRAFDEELEQQCGRTDRYGSPLSLLFIDMDDFKAYNDRYGHGEGDRVLQVLAGILRKNLRVVDTACRYGGEEFVAVLPETGSGNAARVAERIRGLFEAETLEPVGRDGQRETAHKTMSIGVAEHAPGMSAEDLVRQADDAMYRAKRQGKNRVAVRE